MRQCQCGGHSCDCQQLALDVPTMTRVTMVAHQEGAVRRESHDGKDHLIVPVVAVVEGVLNGNLVLAEEFAKPHSLHAWNGVPVPINHPTNAHGTPVSANEPSVVENSVIGRLYHVHVDGKRLKGEIWIDVAKAARLGYQNVIESLEAGEPMEVSTGYFAELEVKQGVHANEQYVGIHRNITPDHLALLPETEGACNWEDGCGAPRLNSEETMQVKEKHQGRILGAICNALGLVTNATSLTDRITEVMQAVDRAAAGDRFRFTLDVLDDNTVVFEEEGVLMRQSFDADDSGQVNLTGSPEEVRLEKSYVPVNTQPATQEEETVDTTSAQKGGLTAEQAETIANADRVVQERREEYVSGIMSNKANPYTEEELRAMSFDHLRGLYKFAVNKPAEEGSGDEGDGGEAGGEAPAVHVDYSHRGGPAPTVHAGKVEPLPMPSNTDAA